MKLLSDERADSVLHESSFQYPDRWLFWARARLYADRLELTGWHWTGRHRRVVPLSDIAQVKWWTAAEHTVNFALHLHDGERVRLQIKGAGLWKFEVEKHADNLDETSPESAQGVASAA